MKKRIYSIAFSMLLLFTVATVFSSCDTSKKNGPTAKSTDSAEGTEIVTSGTSVTDIINEYASKEESTTEVHTYNDSHGYTVYSYVELTNAPTKSQPSEHTEKVTSVPTTADIKEYPTVPEINNGLSCVRTQFASRGQLVTASVIMGTPNAEYTIEFYESEKQLSDSSGLKAKKADSNGTVEWSFLIDDQCELGNRKLVIKEKGTDKYVQTYITVNG